MINSETNTSSPIRNFPLSITAILMLAFIGYGHLWQTGKTLYSPHSDFVAEHAATKQVLYSSLQAGRGIPLWRDDQFSGYGGLVNPQSQFTFPLQFLFFWERPLAAVGGTFFLYFLSAGCAYYLVAAALGLGSWPRLLMATAGMFSFKLIIGAYAGWLTNLSIVVSFPLLFAAVFYFTKQPGLTSGLALAAAGALCLHSGHLQLLYYSFCFLLGYLAIFAYRRLRRRQKNSLGKLSLYLLASSILAVGLTAYLILPLASEARLVSRTQTSYEFFLSDHAISLRHLSTFLYPEAIGTPLYHTYQLGKPGEDELWEDVGYFGLLPLLLAVAGTILGWRRWTTKYFAACFAATVLLSTDSFILRLLYRFLPGFTLFRIPARFLFLTTFFGISLAGIGLEELLERLSGKTLKPYFGRVACALLIAFMTFEGTFYARRYLKMVPYSESVPDTAYQHYLAEDASLYRVAPVIRRTFNYGWAAPMGLQEITGFDSFNYTRYFVYLELLRWNEVRNTVAGPWMDLGPGVLARRPTGIELVVRYDLLDVLNVKYILSPVPLYFPKHEYELAGEFENQPGWLFYQGITKLNVFLYRNNHFFPRVFWAQQIAPADDSNAAISLIQRTNLREVAVVENAPESPNAVAGSNSGADFTQVWAGHLQVETTSFSGGYLVISEVWHPGWRATLDGLPLQLYRTDYSFLGAVIPPGHHQLIVDFHPLYWRLSLWITAISFTLLVGGLIVLVARNRRRHQPGA
jgi:hypothetical protein